MLKYILILLFAGAVNAVGLPDDIYYKVDVHSGSACYRLLNGTHQFGCHTTKQDGSGVVVVIRDLVEAENIKTCWRNRFPEYSGSFFILIDLSLFDKTVIKDLQSATCVNGIILTNKETLSLQSTVVGSHDSQCPNEQTSFYKDGCEKNSWNKKGAIIPHGLRYMDWNKQILYLSNDTHIKSIEQCYDLFNKPNGSDTVTYPLCSASFSIRSMAAGSTEICYRRSMPNSRILDLNIDDRSGICHSLSGRSVVALLPPNKKKEGPKQKSSQYMMLSGRLDSFGFIPEVSFGDISVVTSLISMLAVAKGIGDNYDSFESASAASDKYLLYTLFNGEAFDYIGSSHMLFDIQNNRFPHDEDENALFEQVSPEDIVAVIEPQHIGSGSELKIIVDDKQMKFEEVHNIISSIQKGGLSRSVHIQKPKSGLRMPPSTWHSLMKVNPKAVGVVLAPFTEEYEYRRVNSMLDRNSWSAEDRADTIQQIATAAAAILRVAADYVSISESVKASLVIDDKFVSTLFDCFISSNETYECEFIEKLRGVKTRKITDVKSSYIGVGDANMLQVFAHSLAIYASGTTAHTHNIKDAKQCTDLGRVQKAYNFHWLTDPITSTSHCYRHSVYLDEAISPAFLIEGYDFKNSTYSTWTESVYELDDLKLFLVERKSFEICLFLTGCVISLLAVLIAGRCSEDTFIIDEGDIRAEQGEPL